MTVTLDGRKVVITHADLDKGVVTVTYHDDEFSEGTTHLDHKPALHDRHRGDREVPISNLRVEGGGGVYDRIRSLSESRVSGSHPAIDCGQTDDE